MNDNNTKQVLILLSFLLTCVISCNSEQKKEPLNSKTGTIKIKKPLKITKTSPKNLSKIYGIDISKYQGKEINTLNKQKDSLAFIICKSTEGITYVDPTFSYNWKSIKEKGFIRGVYHFYRSNDNPEKQAQNFLTEIKDINNQDLPPIIDFEEGGIKKEQSIHSVQEGLKKFIAIIENNLKCKPIIYTDIRTGNKYLKDTRFANYPLWIANYTYNKKPNVPIVWKEKGWVIWQKSASYKLDGITNDLDQFNGNLKELKEFIKKSW